MEKLEVKFFGWIIFILATILLVIIMLNFLIAIGNNILNQFIKIYL